MKEEYREAFSEVEQIINLMPTSLSNKIPFGFKQIVSTEKSKTYYPRISEPIEECTLKEETTIILAVMYRDFLCSKQEREKLIERDSKKLLEFEKDLREKYNPDNVFKNRKKLQNTMDNEVVKENAIIEYKEKNFIQKLFEKIKYLFKRSY